MTMKTAPKLRIEEGVLEQLNRHARDAKDDECVGLLAGLVEEVGRVITAACLLPAAASGSRAEADPLAIKRAAVDLCARRLRPMGLWHSHGAHSVFHSATDDRTVARLLPAMAEWNFERPVCAPIVPAVTGRDTAVLPLPDGRQLHFTLVGPEVPGLGAWERVEWSSIRTGFGRSRARPRALQERNRLRLEAGAVRLVLGVPEGAGVHSHVVDSAPLKTAQLYSVVVNNRGDCYAEVVIVHDVAGRSVIQKGRCAVEVVPRLAAAGKCRAVVRGGPGEARRARQGDRS
jgi:proteasome lid subunit RPN8/RPN11